MRIATGLVLTALLATSALAQTPPMATVAAAKTPALSADTALESIVADPAAKAVLDKTLPNISKHPAFDQFKAMSLRQLQPYGEGRISDEAVATVDAELKALPAKP